MLSSASSPWLRSRKMATSIALKRVEPDEDGFHNFWFEIEGELGVAFALSVPVSNAEPNQMWTNAYDILSAILHSAAKKAMELAQHHDLATTKTWGTRA